MVLKAKHMKPPAPFQKKFADSYSGRRLETNEMMGLKVLCKLQHLREMYIFIAAFSMFIGN